MWKRILGIALTVLIVVIVIMATVERRNRIGSVRDNEISEELFVSDSLNLHAADSLPGSGVDNAVE